MSQNEPKKNAADSEFRWLEIDLSDLLFLFRRHLLLVLFLPLGFAICAMLVCFAMRPMFASTAILYLRPNFDREMLIERSFSKLEDADSLRSVERAIISDTVILRMIDRLDLRNDESFIGEAPDPGTTFTDHALLNKVRKRYQTKLLPNTRLVELEVGDYSAERSKMIAETLIYEFLRHLGEERDIQQNDVRLTLVNQADKALEEALASEKQLEKFRSENPTLIVEQDSSIFQDRLLQYSQSLNQASSEKSTLEGTLVALEGIDTEKDPYRIFQILKNRNSDYLSELLGMYAEAKSELASIGEQYTAAHPTYRESQSRLEQFESTLRGYADEMKDGLESEYEAAIRREEKLRESLGDLQTEFVAFKSKSAEFRGLQEKIERNWSTYTQLQEKITELDLNPENEFNFVTLVSKPIVPDKKSRPVTKLWMAAAGFFGLLCVSGILLIRYRNGLPYTTLAQVAEDPSVRRTSSIELSKAKNTESLSDEPDVLNLAILACSEEITHITSPAPDPQADTVIEAIARALGSQKQNTLIMALDFEENDGENLIEPTSTPGVSKITLSARRLLDPEAFQRGLKGCLRSFDRILINTSALKRRDSILATASHSNNDLVLVRKQSLSRTLYRQFFKQLLDHGTQGPIAVVLDGEIVEARPRKRIFPQITRKKKKTSPSPIWTEALPSSTARSTGNA
ncbi:MAG: Wzz/FepE/Etk N-terminal domain-containing protein [Verrucomicrobiota bacterium]